MTPSNQTAAMGGHTVRHCRKCELPREVCACSDAREYDRWWKIHGRRALQQAEAGDHE